MNINELGFLRIAAASPKVKVADCDFNLGEIKITIEKAIEEKVQIISFPELSLSGYTCGDLFFQTALQKKVENSLLNLVEYLKDKQSIIVIVGLPFVVKSSLYNMAAVVSHQGILGLIPKTFIPNNNEFYEKRWFASASDLTKTEVYLGENSVPVYKSGMIFKTQYASFAVEICEDLWMPIPPSCELTQQGVEIIFNLSASNELVGKHEYRRALVAQQSASCNCAYVYAGAACGESTTDAVFSGASIIAENGIVLKESKRFSLETEMIIADVDIQSLRNDRIKNTNFLTKESANPAIQVNLAAIDVDELKREINPHPFIPKKESEDTIYSEVFNIQVLGLAKRLQHINAKTVTIGISGGLDSTLAFLVILKTFDLLKFDRKNIYAITMPGFGTTNRTYTNAQQLVLSTGATLKEISIVESVKQHFKDIEQDENNHDITYENSQARERTQILMDYANKVNGLVVGTGNLSELALGWATYNGDHMSMYGVNGSIPKTLVKTLVKWVADTQIEEKTRAVLHDILDTPFSPELLPANKDGNISQVTEDKIGPYELHDFFLYRLLRYSDEPRRIFFAAQQAFKDEYSSETILRWLKVFYKRFFSQQYKRSCLPDGPKVGSICLSPRGDWRMPSDAQVLLWMEQLTDLNIN